MVLYFKNQPKTRKGVYKTTEWKFLRKKIRNDAKFICNNCKKFVKPVYDKRGFYKYGIVDHIIPLTDNNFTNPEIALNTDNLQLLCLACHNTKTFSSGFIVNGKVDFKKRDKGYIEILI